MHLTDSQLRVQPIRAGQQQEFPALSGEELAAEAHEPVLPVGLCSGEVGAPLPGPRVAGLVIAAAEQGRDAGAGRDGAADGARARVPLDGGLGGLEARGPRLQVRVHVLQGVDGGALDDVEHGEPQQRAAEPPRARELRRHGPAHRVPDQHDRRQLRPLHRPPRQLDRRQQVPRERLEAQVQRLALGHRRRPVAPRVGREDAGRRDALADLVPYDGERES